MKRISYFFFAVALLCTCSTTFSQTSIVMKALDGTTKLNGGSTVPGHVGEIDLNAYSQGESTCFQCNKPSFSDFTFLTTLSAATISFKKLLLNGTKLTSVDITFIKGGTTPFEYYKFHMENVLVSAVQESGSTETPTFSISLTPDKIAWQQISQKTGGGTLKTSYGWDIVANTEFLYY